MVDSQSTVEKRDGSRGKMSRVTLIMPLLPPTTITCPNMDVVCLNTFVGQVKSDHRK
jgi:hypothetical protein